MENEKLIYKKICDIMADVKVISKDRKNQQQNYKFRGIDDVYNELHDLLAKHRVFTVPAVLETKHEERTSKSGGTLIYRIYTVEYTFFAEDGSSVQTIVMGEGMDSGDKAGNKAMSVAHKYALLQMFAIPTGEPKDPENDSPEVIGKDKKGKGKTRKELPKKNPAKSVEHTVEEYYDHGIELLNRMLDAGFLHPNAVKAEKEGLADLLQKNDLEHIKAYFLSLKKEAKKAAKTQKEKAESKKEPVQEQPAEPIVSATAETPAATETADLPDIF